MIQFYMFNLAALLVAILIVVFLGLLYGMCFKALMSDNVLNAGIENGNEKLNPSCIQYHAFRMFFRMRI